MADISTRKRGDKWYYSFEAASVDGKRKRIERVGGKTKKEALEKGIKALNEYNNAGQHFEPSDMSVADLLDFYVDNFSKLNNKYNTVINHVGVIEGHLKPNFGQYRASNLGAGPLQEYLNDKFVHGFAKTTISGIFAPLSKAYDYAIDLGWVRDNPCKRLKYPSDFTKGKGREIISYEDYQTIIKALSNNRPFDVAVMVGWYAGLRISETYGLTWSDIDFDKKTINVNKQVVKRNFGVDVRRAYQVKGKKEERSAWYFQSTKTTSSSRTIVVSDELIKALRKLRAEQLENRMYYGEYYNELYLKDETDEKGKTIQRIIEIEKGVPCSLPRAEMVFRKENGQYSSTDSFKYASRIIHHRLGIRTFDYHSLRHTHATTLIEAGISPKTVQMRLGHSSIKTTLDKYVHDTDDMKQSAVDAFDAVMKGKRA